MNDEFLASKLHFRRERLADGLSRDPPVPHLDNAGGDPPLPVESLFCWPVLLLNLFMELARRRLLERVMRGSGTGFFSKSPSQDLRVKFFKILIFEAVFSTCTGTCTGIGSLDFEASFCLGWWATEVGMVHTEGKVLFYHHAPVRVFIYTTVTDIYFVEKKIIRENKSIKIELTFLRKMSINSAIYERRDFRFSFTIK